MTEEIYAAVALITFGTVILIWAVIVRTGYFLF